MLVVCICFLINVLKIAMCITVIVSKYAKQYPLLYFQHILKKYK